MKKSEGWVRQDMVDKKADEVRAERDCTVGEVKPYWVAEKFGIKPNGAFCLKVYDWRRRRQAEEDRPSIEVPPQAASAFREAIDRFTAEAMASFTRTVRDVGGDIDRGAMLRVADAERRRDQAESDLVDMAEACQETEASLTAALVKIAEFEQELDEARRREDRLLGRLEQRDIDAEGEAIQSGVVPATTAPTETSDGTATSARSVDVAPPESPVILPQRSTDAQGTMQLLPDNGEATHGDGGG